MSSKNWVDKVLWTMEEGRLLVMLADKTGNFVDRLGGRSSPYNLIGYSSKYLYKSYWSND